MAAACSRWIGVASPREGHDLGNHHACADTAQFVGQGLATDEGDADELPV
jgi:hypothetical protein